MTDELKEARDRRQQRIDTEMSAAVIKEFEDEQRALDIAIERWSAEPCPEDAEHSHLMAVGVRAGICMKCGERCPEVVAYEAKCERRNREYLESMDRRTSHDLARELLALPDRHLIFVVGGDGEYVAERYMAGKPWDSGGLGIRLTLKDADDCIAVGPG